MVEQAGRDAWMFLQDPASPDVRIGFTPRLWLAAHDLTQEPVHEGMQISKRAFHEIDLEARTMHAGPADGADPDQGTRLLQLPRKFRRTNAAELRQTLQGRIGGERRAQNYFDEQHIAYLDVSPVLGACIREHQQVYSPRSDGHPQAAGYSAIAEAISAAIRERFPRHS